MTNEKDLSHSICHCQKPLQQKDLTAKMMDDRLFFQKQFLIEITLLSGEIFSKQLLVINTQLVARLIKFFD